MNRGVIVKLTFTVKEKLAAFLREKCKPHPDVAERFVYEEGYNDHQIATEFGNGVNVNHVATLRMEILGRVKASKAATDLLAPLRDQIALLLKQNADFAKRLGAIESIQTETVVWAGERRHTPLVLR